MDTRLAHDRQRAVLLPAREVARVLRKRRVDPEHRLRRHGRPLARLVKQRILDDRREPAGLVVHDRVPRRPGALVLLVAVRALWGS